MYEVKNNITANGRQVDVLNHNNHTESIKSECQLANTINGNTKYSDTHILYITPHTTGNNDVANSKLVVPDEPVSLRVFAIVHILTLSKYTCSKIMTS